MTKRAALHPAQMAFSFDAPSPADRAASLAGLDRLIAAMVAQALKSDERSRFEIAGAMSALLDEDVTRLMLDAYASEARENHNISTARFLALIAATKRFDLLDQIVIRIGGRVLVGEEVALAELGHIDREIAALNDRKKALQAVSKPIRRAGGR